MSAPKLNHVELQSHVVDLLKQCGFEHLHVRKSIGTRRGGARGYMTTTNLKGWPDLLAWSKRQPGRHIAIEIKVPPDTLRPEQREVMAGLAAAGFECWVLTEDWLQKFAQTLRRRG